LGSIENRFIIPTSVDARHVLFARQKTGGFKETPATVPEHSLVLRRRISWRARALGLTDLFSEIASSTSTARDRVVLESLTLRVFSRFYCVSR
jgi:hypothetical protein